jgi:imidazolonepropionase-like amidohydrolase
MKRWSELIAAAALCLVLGLAMAMTSSTSTPQMPAATGFVVQGARVFDGERDLGVATVVVRDGRIEAVGAETEAPAGLAIVDGHGKTLLPGFFDAHVHAWGDAQRDMVRFGVTTGLDMHGIGERAPALRAQRDALDNGSLADLWAAGYAITAPGGHGTQYGFPVPAVEGDTDIDAFIGARVDEGADFIKLIVEDLSAYGSSRRLPTLTAAQVRATVAAAHARERLAVLFRARAEGISMREGLVEEIDSCRGFGMGRARSVAAAPIRPKRVRVNPSAFLRP